jgi:RNA-directed DNA polymerase
LGIPTVADRVARRYLEPVFHADSYGNRPGKSAIDAVAKARERCWRYDWVLDLDIRSFFDSLDWELPSRPFGIIPTAHGCSSTSSAG